MKMKNRNMNRLIFASAIIVSLASCKKEYDSPPLSEIPEGNLLTIDDIRNWFNSQRYLQMTEENKEIKLKELLKYLKQSSKHYTITDLVGEVNNY